MGYEHAGLDAQDSSDGPVSGRDARLARVGDRAVAAGLEAWWTQFRNPQTGQGEGPYGMRVHLPSGQRTRSVSLVGGEEAEVLLKFPFERWTVLHGYEAILDPDQQRIVAEVTVLGTSLSRIPGVVVGPPETDEPVGDGAAGRRLAFKLGPALGPSSLTLAGGEGDLVVELRSRAPAEIRALHGLSSGGGASLIVRGLSTRGHDEARALLEDLSAAVFIELDRSYGLAGRLNRTTVDELMKLEYDEESVSSSLPRLPAARYGCDAASLYLYARSVRSQAPLLEYLGYYQVIEYYMGAFSKAATIERVRTMLKDSRFDHDDELAISRLIDAVLPGGRGEARERDQVLATVGACLDDATIARFLEDRPAAAKALRESTWITGVRVIIAGDNQPSLTRQIAERIYDLRCRIVHSKDSHTDAEPLHPFGPEAKRLQHDMHLVRFVAQHVLTTTSKPANWEQNTSS